MYSQIQLNTTYLLIRPRALLQRFLEKPTVKTLSITPETADVYAQVKHLLKKGGTPIPLNDVWIGAQALEIGAVLITDDSHFSHIAGFRSLSEGEGTETRTAQILNS